RQHPLEIHDLPVIQNRNLRRLARGVAQGDEMRVRGLAQIEAAGDDVAEDEALDPELVGAVDLLQESGLLEGGEEAKRRRAGDARAGGQFGERQARLAEREYAQQLERLGRGVDGVAGGRRHDLRTAFHWVRRYIVG